MEHGVRWEWKEVLCAVMIQLFSKEEERKYSKTARREENKVGPQDLRKVKKNREAV